MGCYALGGRVVGISIMMSSPCQISDCLNSSLSAGMDYSLAHDVSRTNGVTPFALLLFTARGPRRFYLVNVILSLLESGVFDLRFSLEL